MAVLKENSSIQKGRCSKKKGEVFFQEGKRVPPKVYLRQKFSTYKKNLPRIPTVLGF